MNDNITEALRQVAIRKNIPKNIILETIKRILTQNQPNEFVISLLKRTHIKSAEVIEKLIKKKYYETIEFIVDFLKSTYKFSFENYTPCISIIQSFPGRFEDIFKEMIENKVPEDVIIENFEILKDCGFKLIEYSSENTIIFFIRECIYLAIISLKFGYNKFPEEIANYLKELNKISKEKLNKNLVDEILTEMERTKSFGIKIMISEKPIKFEEIPIKDELLENFQKFKEIYYKK